jgi:alkylmercury lyase
MDEAQFERIAAAILALFPPLPVGEQRLALTLYRLLAEEGEATVATLARVAGLSAADVERALRSWSGVQREPDGAVVGYGGLTSRETSHRMRLGRHTRYAWCAWDTLFIPSLVKTPALVESTCAGSGERIAVTVRPDGIQDRGEARFVSLVAPDPTKAGADIVGHFCCHVHFFRSEAAGRQWVSQRPGLLLATLDQAWQLGRQRNARRYPMLDA